MAVDRTQLTRKLHDFYDFRDKVVLMVGVGAGHLFDIRCPTRRLVAIDHNVESLSQERAILASQGAELEILATDFKEASLLSDVVYFEFCLHEMVDPGAMLSHAKSLAPDIVAFDHSRDSAWSFYAAESELVARSSMAMEGFGVRRRQTVCVEQRFMDYAELRAKVAAQGRLAMERVQTFAAKRDIVIPMRCQLVLL